MHGSVCLICRRQKTSGRTWNGRACLVCEVCGRYNVDAGADAFLQFREEANERRHLISAATREATERGGFLDLTGDYLETLVGSEKRPLTPDEKIDRLLVSLHYKSQGVFGAEVRVAPELDYPLACAKNVDECAALKDVMVSDGLIVQAKSGHYILTRTGWSRAGRALVGKPRSNRAFVAMTFSGMADQAYHRGFLPALEACGYRVTCLLNYQHNQKIDDLIVAEIRRSGLVLADFTEQKQNVYYEAGLAMGLGIPVVRTCRQDELANGRCHFDTRQYYHLGWSEGEYDALRAALVAHLRALGFDHGVDSFP